MEQKNQISATAQKPAEQTKAVATATKTEGAPKPTTAQAQPAQAKPMTSQQALESALQRIQDLEEQLRREPKTIEERIAYYQRKQELTERYEQYRHNIERLKIVATEVKEQGDNVSDFDEEQNCFSIPLVSPTYNHKVFTITNPQLIGDVLTLLINRLMLKSKEIEKAIAD